jgi:hypothetical protein
MLLTHDISCSTVLCMIVEHATRILRVLSNRNERHIIIPTTSNIYIIVTFFCFFFCTHHKYTELFDNMADKKEDTLDHLPKPAPNLSAAAPPPAQFNTDAIHTTLSKKYEGLKKHKLPEYICARM